MSVLIKNRRLHFYGGIFAAVLLILYTLPFFSALAYSIPAPSASFYVNDTAGIIDKDSEDYLVAANEELYAKSGAQIVVVTIPGLEGASIEEYSNELFRKYGIGDAEKNNGILFLLSLDDRECRIEVGYGLEGVINDAKAGRIMDRYMIPYFKEGKWNEGIVNGFDAVLTEVCKEYGIEVAHHEASIPSKEAASEDSGDDMMLWAVVAAGICGLIGGLLIGHFFPGKAMVPGIIFLIVDFLILIGVLSSGYAALSIVLTIPAYIIGWGITSPDIGGSSGSSYSSSSRGSYSSSSRSSSGSSSRNYGGGGRSGGGGASRKF